MSIGEPEKITQAKVTGFFKDREILDYTYLGNLEDKANANIKEDLLRAYLHSCGYDQVLIDGAVNQLVKAAGDMTRGIYDANKTVYSLLKYGAKVRPSPEMAPKTVYFLDADHPTNNHFAIAEEVTIVMTQEKRPDIVIYLNGIAVAVIELKKSSVSVSTGIRQNLTNQKDSFIQPFFSTVQFCMAGNETEGLRYGTLLTKEKFYLEWKPDGFHDHKDERTETDIRIDDECAKISNKLLRQLYAMFDKERFIDLIENFIVFDKGIKKVCRYNQYYGIKRAQMRLAKDKGGIIWHTQGSGKTLTMVWLSKWLLAHGYGKNPRVLIVTDRDELDEQIEKTFKGVDESITRTTSGQDLIDKLNSYDDSLICSLVHKFGKRGGEASEADYDKFIEEIMKSLPESFEAKGKLYVFVDECHRTQSGKLHGAMKAIMPKAIFVGFTGTPLLKKDKKTSIEVFGPYIHAYKYDEAVRDGVVLDLRYEYRDIPQDLSSQDKVDLWFDTKTRGLSPRAKAKLKEKWATMQKVYSSRSRLEKIAWDIIEDFDLKPRLMDGNGNAILVADSIYSACKYYEIFQSRGFKKCAIISSYTPNVGDLRTDTVSDEDDTETFEKYEIYLKMLGLDPENLPEKFSIQKRVEDFEEEAKRKFVEEPANMKLLIVVDKLLTGFDAPPCTYLYVDKSMQDHGLFQAICRVNRLDNDSDSKDFGYIVDYKQLFGDLKSAMDTYTSGALSGYDEVDVAGLIKDRGKEAIAYFKETYDELEELCEGVEEPREDIQYLHYFCGASGTDEETQEIYARMREKLYRLVSRLVRAYAEAKPYLTEVYTSTEINAYEDRVRFYIELKQAIGNDSGDFLDFKAYEPDMRKLIDNYIIASESVKIGDFDDLTLLDFIKNKGKDLDDDDKPKSTKDGAAEAIENNIRRKIVEKVTVNPKYYDKMSAILDKLIEQRHQGVIAYSEQLALYIKLAKNVEHPEENEDYPESIRNSRALQAIYDNVGENEELAIRIHKAVLKSKLPGFRGDSVKEHKIQRELFRVLNDDDEVARIFKIIKKQEEY
ncbi:type I restriction endonuclease subunit R [Caproiciproducens faecalis]|jgi:type I restriction enzyme R subunit|uniref:Type I restriction enzyme endonuclease subunit n=1 Tax=Caproiciproducens faecalis TaxID=2820301 RepID=A0ABS7DK82_9FIRM|nr:HsdR family type I site-specific deoxyribonuclease [Caproiciproducens faecalis]MBW7571250.1 HsdR family type I site-specific deoxyribonuclease [Caproiciproducens faecalis]